MVYSAASTSDRPRMEIAMETIAERVNQFITVQKPRAICDDCIAAHLDLSRRQQSARVTGALETTSDFIRETGECGQCKNEKKVIRRA